MHITQRTNYSIIAKAVKDIREKTEKEEVEDSVLRVNPSLYRD